MLHQFSLREAWLQSHPIRRVFVGREGRVVSTADTAVFCSSSYVILMFTTAKRRATTRYLASWVVMRPKKNGWMSGRSDGFVGDGRILVEWVLKYECDWVYGWTVVLQNDSTQVNVYESGIFLRWGWRLACCQFSCVCLENMSMEQLEISEVEPIRKTKRRWRKTWPQHLAASLGKIPYYNYLFSSCRHYWTSLIRMPYMSWVCFSEIRNIIATCG